MKVLILGSGGREHAIAQSISRNGHQVVCHPGNAGTTSYGQKSIPLDKQEELATFARQEGIELTIVGPEAPLAAGIVDYFRKDGLAIFGPNRRASILESSKVWAKEFMAKYAIPTAPFFITEDLSEALEKVHFLIKEWGGVVIKPDGLTAGKGVIPCDSLDEALNALRTLMEQEKYGSAGRRVVIEKMLSGPEVSVLALCDGKTIVPLIPSQDHKRLLEGDRGPNTGGVGAYAPYPFASSKDYSEIIKKTLDGLRSEGMDYTGVIYCGLMLTEDGAKVLEYNCRFGDPEAQAVLPLLESDLAELLLSCCKKELDKQQVQWSKKSSCCVVMSSKGYPETYTTGHEITGLDAVAKEEDVFCFHSGTRYDSNGRVVTSGGRVLGVTALGDTLEDAAEKAYQAVDKLHFEGACYRRDIAHQALHAKSCG